MSLSPVNPARNNVLRDRNIIPKRNFDNISKFSPVRSLNLKRPRTSSSLGQHLQTLREIDDLLCELTLDLRLADTHNQDVKSNEFQGKFHDVLFNAGRRCKLNMNGKVTNDWRNKYMDNYNNIEAQLKQLQKLPDEQQKDIYNALRLGTVVGALDPRKYEKQMSDIIERRIPAKEFIAQQLPVLQKMQRNSRDLSHCPLANEAKKLNKISLIPTSRLVKYFGDFYPPSRKYQFEKGVDSLNTMIKSPPAANRPRVLLFWNSREGQVGRMNDNNTSYENAALTDKLKDYWQQKGCDVVTVDGAGGSTSRELDVSALFKSVQPSGFITGGGPDPNARDPFVHNMKKLIEYSDRKKVPYFGECLGHQLIGMIKSGHTNYLKYIGQLKDRHNHSPGDISILDTRRMEDDHALYKGELGKVLRNREGRRVMGELIDPVKVYCIHNNILNEKHPMAPRIFIGAHSMDHDKSPEVLVKQNEDGQREVIATQFHPSELTAASRYLKKLNPNDEEFGLAILNSSIAKMKEFHKGTYS